MRIKRTMFSILLIAFVIGITACGSNSSEAETEEPSNIVIETGITNALKEDEHIKFDRMSDFTFVKVDVNEEDMNSLKTKYASQIPFVKYETTFALTSVEMDIKGNYTGVYVFNNGEWQYSFGYVTDKTTWDYKEKEASRVDKQRMLEDLKEQSFGTFEKGYVGDAKYSSIGSITSREYNETVHQDVINTDVKIKTDFAEYSIPIIMTYYFQQGTWELGGIEISDISEWELTYNNGSAPEFLSDNTLLSYLTTSTNFLTYICNLDYVQNYKITKESEVASKESVAVNYIFSVTYQYIGTVEYNVELVYEWLNNEWSEPQPTPSVKGADFSEMVVRDWSNEDGTYFKFTSAEPGEEGTVKLTGQYVDGKATDIVATVSVMLRDNNWDASLTDINGNQIWDIPSSSFSLNLEYGAIVYNNKYYAPVEINIIESEIVEEEVNTSNVLAYEHEDATFDNQITRDNLMVSEIAVSYADGSMTITGNILNEADGQSPYNISVAMFDKDDYIVAEGTTNSGDSLLLPNSAAIFKINVGNLSDEDHEKINKIIVYVKSQ